MRKGKADHVLNEYRIMKMLDHPSILGIHCALQDNRYLFFLLDLHPGMFLFAIYFEIIHLLSIRPSQ